MSKRKQYTTPQVAAKLSLTHGALRTRMSRDLISRPTFETTWPNGTVTVTDRRGVSGNLIWFYTDIKQAQKELKHGCRL